MTTCDVATRLGVSVDLVRTWIASGELRAVDVSAKRGRRPTWRVELEALEAFLASRANRMLESRSRRRRRRQQNVIEFF